MESLSRTEPIFDVFKSHVIGTKSFMLVEAPQAYLSSGATLPENKSKLTGGFNTPSVVLESGEGSTMKSKASLWLNCLPT